MSIENAVPKYCALQRSAMYNTPHTAPLERKRLLRWLL